MNENQITDQSIVGTKFNRLTVIATTTKRRSRAKLITCRCDCGTIADFVRSRVVSGSTKSCGCLRREMAVTKPLKHGATAGGKTDSTYVSWIAMIYRCTNPKHTQFRHYGGRGISVCERWLNSFDEFVKDAGPRPGKEYSIDRINSNGNYEPGNVKWSTASEQSNNRRGLRKLSLHGETLTITEWARRLNTTSNVIAHRLGVLGWTTEKALTTPVRPKRTTPKPTESTQNP